MNHQQQMMMQQPFSGWMPPQGNLPPINQGRGGNMINPAQMMG